MRLIGCKLLVRWALKEHSTEIPLRNKYSAAPRLRSKWRIPWKKAKWSQLWTKASSEKLLETFSGIDPGMMVSDSSPPSVFLAFNYFAVSPMFLAVSCPRVPFVALSLLATLTGHFINYTLLDPGWTFCCLQNCFNCSFRSFRSIITASNSWCWGGLYSPRCE